MDNVVYGYHATTRESAGKILDTGFRLSTNPWEWLGFGIYFFQDAPLRAYRWGVEWHERDDIVVLQARIRLENCLDLLDIEWNEFLCIAYRSFVEKLTEAGGKFPVQQSRQRRLDCAVLNHACGILKDNGRPIYSIRAAFDEGNPVYQGSSITTLSHVQVAVRDVSVIEECEEVTMQVFR